MKVRHLLKEVEEARGGVVSTSQLASSLSDEESDGTITSSAEIISKRLVTFRYRGDCDLLVVFSSTRSSHASLVSQGALSSCCTAAQLRRHSNGTRSYWQLSES